MFILLLINSTVFSEIPTESCSTGNTLNRVNFHSFHHVFAKRNSVQERSINWVSRYLIRLFYPIFDGSVMSKVIAHLKLFTESSHNQRYKKQLHFFLISKFDYRIRYCINYATLKLSCRYTSLRGIGQFKSARPRYRCRDSTHMSNSHCSWYFHIGTISYGPYSLYGPYGS